MIVVLAVMAVMVLPAQAVVLPESITQQLQQRFDAFINADGYTEMDMSSFANGAWYSPARFPQSGSGQSGVFRPDHALDPVTRMVLFVNGLEKPLPHLRYRITYRLVAAPDDYADVQHAYVEITRFNLGPKLQRELEQVANGQYPVAPADVFGIGPHVSWRFVTTAVQGMAASVVRASRREISDGAAQAADCLGVSCLSLSDPMGPAQGDWRELQPPQLEAPVYSDSDGFMPGPARIGQALFAFATRHGEEPAYGNFTDKPQMVFVISKDIEGQDRTINGLLHEPYLMDDAISDIWTRRLQATPDAIQWRTLAVPRPGRSVLTPQSPASQRTDAAAGGADVQPTASQPAQDTDRNLPRFEDYPVDVDDEPPVLSRRLYSKRSALASEAPDFAGEFIVYQWGCGTGCGESGIVNMRSGEDLEQTFQYIYRSSPIQGVYVVRGDDGSISARLPLGSYGHFLVDGEAIHAHQANSRLLITTQVDYLDYGTFPFRYYHNYYVLDQGRLKRIRQAELAQPYRDDAAVSLGADAHGLLPRRADDVPLFGDYPVSSVYTGPPGELQLKVNGDLRARIQQQLAEPPVFAGAYIIAEQACPASPYCKMQFLINRKTGRAVPTFFKADAVGSGEDKFAAGEWVRTAAADSRLLITQKVVPGKNGQSTRYFNNYYILRDGDLKLINRFELPDPFVI